MKLCSARSLVFRLSSHWEKPLLGTTRWVSQNHRFASKTQCLSEGAQVGLSRFARQSLSQTFRNTHPNFLPIKLSISQSWGCSPGQETQQPAFHQALALPAEVALRTRALTEGGDSRCLRATTPTALGAGIIPSVCDNPAQHPKGTWAATPGRGSFL